MDFLKSEKLAESHKNWASEIVYFVYFAYQVDEPRKNDSHAFDEEYNSRESLKKKSESLQTEGRHFRSTICKINDV